MTWCQCGNCVIMPISHEYICYVMKKEESASEISCITNHEGFESVCLKVWVLQAAYFSYRYHYGDAEEKNIHEKATHWCAIFLLRNFYFCRKYHFTAYQQLVGWCCWWLGQRVRVVLPSCAVNKIRKTSFSSTSYARFKYLRVLLGLPWASMF